MKQMPALLGFGLLSVSRLAFAQGGNAAAAEKLFNEALALSDKGNDAAACPLFAESQKLDPAPGTLLNLANCEEKTGRRADAFRHYRELASRLPETDERRSFAEKRMAALAAALPKLTIELADGAPAGTKVFRDDLEIPPSELKTPTPAEPGEHIVVVRAPGRPERTFRVSLGVGGASQIAVAPGDATAQRPPGPPSSAGSAPRTVGMVGMGIGGAGLLLGGITGVAAIAMHGSLANQCKTRGCTAGDISGYDTVGGVSTASFVIGITGLGVGTLFYVVGSSEAKPEPKSAWVKPVVGPTSIGAVGRF